MRQGIMLCYPFSQARFESWENTAIVQRKLDGERCRAIINDGNVTLLSSEENVITSVPHINESLRNLGLPNCELDGELYLHGASLQQIHSIVSRTNTLHSDFKRINYHIFDIVNELPQARRSLQLMELSKHIGVEHIVFEQYEIATSLEDIIKLLECATEEGYEGIVARHPAGLYVRKRSTAVMKFKPRKCDVYDIIGWNEEVSVEGVPKNTLGALILKSPSCDEMFKVGSGSYLTREQRATLWQNRQSLLGKKAVVKYQRLTDRHVPMFPVLVDIV